MSAQTRRRFLAASAVTCTAIAGCLASDDEGNPDEIDTADRPALGSADAPVRVTVFEDFSCPGCRQFKEQIFPLIVEHHVEPGDVRVLPADFPIPVEEPWSWAVPNAARAVFEETGNDAYWGFTQAIYTHQGNYSYDTIESVADEAGDVGATARDAAENRAYSDAIDADIDRGEAWGVGGTPTVFVEETMVDSDYESISDAIDDEL